MIKRHKGTWIAMYICALVSLVLLCSASWFIISLETHPISNVDAEMDAYKIMDADTSGSFNVSQDVIYNGKTYTLDQIKSEIVAAKKTELYGKYVEHFAELYGYDKTYVSEKLTEQIYDAMLYDKTMEYLLKNNTAHTTQSK